MTWIWPQKNWPHFSYKSIFELDEKFVQNAGILTGLQEILDDSVLMNIKIEQLSEEAFRTSEIEGELLNRDSVKLSIRKNIQKQEINWNLKENNIAAVVVDAQNSVEEPLSQNLLFRWYKMLMKNRHDLLNAEGFRTHQDAMQIVSTATGEVYYEAPPSKQVPEEMKIFIDWFNSSKELSPLVRAGIAHLHFVMIHPFEDGNGRISRLLAEKALAQYLKRPLTISISAAIQKNRKKYYDALEQANHSIEIDNWLQYFAETVIEAQENLKKIVKFTVKKSSFYNKFGNFLNERQKKAITTIFKYGSFEFVGGMSAEKYIAITGTSRATATRDLNDLVEKGIMIKSGERRYARYQLNQKF